LLVKYIGIMSSGSWLITLQDMVPPKDPYAKVRILKDLDAGILLSDKTVTLSCNSIQFLMLRSMLLS
ncbi:hypothetical protein Tsubulata_035079, partial [Turnera subulata]